MIQREVENIDIIIFMNDLPQTDASACIGNIESEINEPNVYFYAKP